MYNIKVNLRCYISLPYGNNIYIVKRGELKIIWYVLILLLLSKYWL